MSDEEIQDKIDMLKKLNKELDEYDKFTEILIANSNFPELLQEISPKERAELTWEMSYSTYTLSYVYSKLKNEDPRDLPLKDEMKRVQDFHQKLQDAKEGKSKEASISKIDKEAAERTIKNLLSTNNQNTTRKLKRNIPLPEQTHLNWQNNLNK